MKIRDNPIRPCYESEVLKPRPSQQGNRTTGMSATTFNPALRNPVGGREAVFMGLAVLAILASREHSYLLFHTLVEFCNICVVLTAFSLAWNTRHHLEDDFLRVAGLALGPSASILLLHTLTYKGLGVFAPDDANLPTQLWVAQRLMQAGALFAATLPAITRRRDNAPLMVSSAAGIILGSLIFSGLFPDCFVDGQGLTPFKIVAESFCMVLVAWAAFRMWRERKTRHKQIRKLAVGLLLCGALESAAFTLYQDVYGALNMAGHILGLMQSFLLYSAIAWVGLTNPLESLFVRQSTLRSQFERDAALAQDDMARFAEILAHHMQEPVRQQHVFTQALVKALPRPLPPEVAQPLDFIISGAMRQRSLLRDALLYLSLAEPVASPAKCSLDDAMDISARELAERIKQSRAKITYTNLPAVAVPCTRLRALFMTLLDNSLTYARPGIPPRIDIQAESQDSMACVRFSDNGIGIPPEMRIKAFGIFERLKHDGDGTGIGLAIARRVVDTAGGHIWIEDSPSGGTTIKFTLPLA